MAQSERLQSLSDLRSILNDTVNSARSVIMTEFYKHPSQTNMSGTVLATLTNERVIQRNRCITAEYNQIVREEPYDDNELSKNVNSFFRNFELLEHDFPDIYNTSDTNKSGIIANVKLANKGIYYDWDKKPIYLKLTLKPDSGELIPYSDNVTDANFRQWFFLYQAGQNNAFSIHLLHDELNSLGRRSYYAVFELYEGSVTGGSWNEKGSINVDGETSQDSIKFNGGFATNFVIIENGM